MPFLIALVLHIFFMFKLGNEFHPVAELDEFPTYLTFIPMPIDIRFTANSHKTCSCFQLSLTVLQRSSLSQRVNLCLRLCVFPFYPPVILCRLVVIHLPKWMKVQHLTYIHFSSPTHSYYVHHYLTLSKIK